MEKLILIANLGRVRALKLREAGLDPQDQAHLSEDPGSPFEMRPEMIREVVTDQAGRFGQSNTVDRKGGMSYGEEHELEAELRAQALGRIAGKISEIVTEEGFPRWRLIATQEHLSSIQDALPTAVRQSMGGAEAGDLTRVPLAELEKRLLHA